MTATLMVSMVFAVVTLVLLAVALLVRDLRLGAEKLDEDGVDEADPRATLEAAAASVGERPRGLARLNAAFYELVLQAGSPVTAATAVALVVGGGAVGAALPLALLDSLPGAAAGLLVGAALPLVLWQVQRLRRLAKLNQQLPAALDQLADSVRSGRGLEQALAEAAATARLPLARELKDCAAQLAYGQAPALALGQLARRLPLAEVRLFVAAATVHRQTGGDLARLVERLAAAARDRQQLRGHLQSVTAGSRMSALGLLAVSALAVVALGALQPEYLETLLHHAWGPALLTVAGALELVGLAWVSRIMKVEY